jgi:hypothetical protein
VGTGFPSRQTPGVCAEIMLKQKDIERDDETIIQFNIVGRRTTEIRT